MPLALDDGIAITYYTDPLCCWSWAMEPSIRKLQYCLKNQLQLRYCMGGLIPSWKNFNDPVNFVSRPIQMGPVWMHAAELTGMKIDSRLWFKDAPSSSYPACIAYKCVELQSTELADIYLRLLREACMVEGINIACQSELILIANRLSSYSTEFDVNSFKNDLHNGKGREAFRADLNEVKVNEIQRFPTWIFRRKGNDPVVISGYQPFAALLKIVLHLCPGIIWENESIHADTFKDPWPFGFTQEEMREVLSS
ncbi:MAG: DsbA oxidoreductase [Ferruginibacter sp.]|nr:DsbA oxidoreductase [Ferruginibacter sp.]